MPIKRWNFTAEKKVNKGYSMVLLQQTDKGAYPVPFFLQTSSTR